MLQTADAGLAKRNQGYADGVDLVCDVRSKRQYPARFPGGRRFLSSLKAHGSGGFESCRLPIVALRTPSKRILSAHDQASPAKSPSGCDE
jgi:hypothetical protein